jgi:hypothetical protein
LEAAVFFDTHPVAQIVIGVRNMSSKSVLAMFLVSCTSLFWTVDTAAQTISPEKIALAQQLYDEGAALMEQGKLDEACPKLEEAVALVPEGVGAKLELANCYEKAGRYASAWRAFKIAESASALAGQAERRARAQEHATAIEPKLSTLTVVVPDSVRQLPGFVLARNGAIVDRTDWNTPIPVDGGTYRLEAIANGKNRWLRVVEVGPTAVRAQVEIGMLEDEPQKKPIPPTNVRPWQKSAGLAVGGVGLAGAVIGFIVGGAAISKNGESNAPGRCDAQNQCDQTGLDLRNEAKSLAGASTGLVIVGSVLLASGVIVWATAPKATPMAMTHARRSEWSTAIEVGPSGLSIRGKW